MVLLEILFVRHGLSCANALKIKDRVSSGFYRDPELTTYGKERSEQLTDRFTAYVNRIFPNNAYSIGASTMIRAQQTAYYMLAKNTDKKIHILPHIGETGLTPANIPLKAEKQKTIMSSGLVRKLGEDARGDTKYGIRSNWSKFIEWVNTLYETQHHLAPFFTETMNAKGETVYRAVIVSHSNFLKSVFGPPKLINNDMIFATINTETKEKRIQRYDPLIALDETRKQDTAGCLLETPSDVRAQYSAQLWEKAQRFVGATRKGGKARKTRKTRKTRMV